MQRMNLHIDTKKWFSVPTGRYVICGAIYVDL